jgi:hypothetical protein
MPQRTHPRRGATNTRRVARGRAAGLRKIVSEQAQLAHRHRGLGYAGAHAASWARCAVGTLLHSRRWPDTSRLHLAKHGGFTFCKFGREDVTPITDGAPSVIATPAAAAATAAIAIAAAIAAAAAVAATAPDTISRNSQPLPSPRPHLARTPPAPRPHLARPTAHPTTAARRDEA